ncbi:hypothetical protein N7466_003324 [Penicillium verhagenii]|uniref:uncharacterized protein n=1 Tax=Penicillium verhagenii TaxID=1562060 RepID=UPI0025451296|nr:uncharacterized protein N7466_003324 [Penicillium verhagenii]KAJ5936874.1 hypothetical protein N7466_003324 [Penicillium verhagenii]
MTLSSLDSILLVSLFLISQLSPPNTFPFSSSLPLHISFTPPLPPGDDLLTVDDYTYPTFSAALEYCQEAHTHPDDHYDQLKVDDTPEDLFEDAEDLEADVDDDDPGSWEALARQCPADDTLTYLPDGDALGSRDLDTEYRWEQHIGQYPDILLGLDYWKLQKINFPATLGNTTDASPRSLNTKQMLLYELVVGHYARWLEDHDLPSSRPFCGAPLPYIPEQLLINLDGRARTGKSHLISILSSILQGLADRASIRGSPSFQVEP